MKKKASQKLVLLDAHALLHRAYHALPEFSNSKGIPTGGLYGFLSMILRIVNEFHPDYIVACYDLPQKTFRHEAYDNYKGHRAKIDDALVDQIENSRLICQKFGIPIYDLPGFEADDMLGTIVEQTKKDKNLDILIATGDMDSLQLVVDDKVRVFTLKKGINDTVIYNEEAVRERFGFGPEHLPDFKGLRGDPSDNIIGVPGIGEKTATELITKFGSIEDIYKTIHKNKQKLLDEGIKERTVNLLEEHEEGAIFSKTLATIRRDAPIAFVIPEKTWTESWSQEEVEAFLREFEFKSLIPRVRGLKNGGVSSSVETTPETVTNEKDELQVPETVSQESKIAMWLLNSDLTDPTPDDIFSYTKTSNDGDARKKLEEDLRTQQLDFVYQKIELPLVPILENMQQHGVLLDTAFLKKLSEELHEELKKYEQTIYAHVGHEFNINSPKQLGEILFGEMKLQEKIKGFKVKKTATGTYSTKESDLEKLQEVHPIIHDIFEYRELQKLLSTYIDNMPTMVDGGGRLHPKLLQMGSATGRFACKDPNIQNIPIRSEAGKKIRKAFIAPVGSSLVAADYSQIELRSAAILSGDETLLDSFRKGQDIHSTVAAAVFHVPPTEITGNMRRQAKVINFGMLYGMGVTSLQKSLGASRAEAQQFYDEYFRQLPKLSEYIDTTIERAKEMGYTETLFGRKRFFPGLRSKIPFIKAMAERAASNAPIQGTTADIIKLAMIHMDAAIKSKGLGSQVFMVMQIHDELVFEVENTVIDEAKELIRQTMEQVFKDTGVVIKNEIPLDVSVEVGKTWGDTKG